MSALHEYITIADIRNSSLKAFPDSVKQDAVDATNEFYEAHAAMHGVNKKDIAYPINLFVKDALVAYCEMKMAEENVTGINTGDYSGPSKYDVIYQLRRKDYLSKINKVNAGLIKGGITRENTLQVMIDHDRAI